MAYGETDLKVTLFPGVAEDKGGANRGVGLKRFFFFSQLRWLCPTGWKIHFLFLLILLCGAVSYEMEEIKSQDKELFVHIFVSLLFQLVK